MSNQITTKKILERFDIWRQDALMTPAAYRLLVYVPWDEIPKEIKEKFNPDLEKIWDEYMSFEEIEKDIELHISTVFTRISKRLVMESFLFVPTILADLFILGKGVSALEGRYKKHINDFAELAPYDRPIAEIEAMYNMANLMKEIAKKMKIKLEYNIDDIVAKIIEDQELLDKEATTSEMPENIGDIVDKAIADYEEATGENVLEGIEEGADISKLKEALEEELKKAEDKDGAN